MKITIDVREDLTITGEKFTPGMAWIDLQIQLANGETEPSLRGLAARWKWSKSSVARFLSKLKIESILGHKMGQQAGQDVGQQQTLISTSYKENRDTERDSKWDTLRDTNNTSRTRVIDDSISGDLELFSNIPPTHKQESKDSVCSAPQGAKAKRSVFVPPTQDEVAKYCREAGLVMDPAEFFDHFTSNGWLVSGKSKMKDWKAAARNWARNQKRFGRVEEAPRAPQYERKKINYYNPSDDPNYKAQ